jgi:hypothetical protein
LHSLTATFHAASKAQAMVRSCHYFLNSHRRKDHRHGGSHFSPPSHYPFTALLFSEPNPLSQLLQRTKIDRVAISISQLVQLVVLYRGWSNFPPQPGQGKQRKTHTHPGCHQNLPKKQLFVVFCRLFRVQLVTRFSGSPHVEVCLLSFVSLRRGHLLPLSTGSHGQPP